MQTTLLSIGIAIILALVAALVGPYFIDWTQYRSLFESRASSIIGLPVRVNGKIDVRLLPTPQVTLRDIEAGTGEAGAVARELSVELSLGSLLRGEWHASELRLVGPEFVLEVDPNGHLDWPGEPPKIDADALSIERLSIEDGRAVVVDHGGSSPLVLDRLWFNGEVRSLAGPFRGEGGFASEQGDRYGYRLTTGRLGDDGIRVRLGLDPTDRPLTIEADGMLRFAGGTPSFDGGLTLSRPLNVASNKALATEPWRAVAKVKASAARAVFDQIELQYGPDERAIKMTGAAELKLGAKPRLDAVLNGRQVDLDRALALPEGQRLPVAAVRRLGELIGGGFATSIPIRIGIGIDAVTLAGAPLQMVRGDFATEGAGWNIETFEFRAPGATNVRLSGRLAITPDGTSFTGPAVVEASDPRALFAWLEGRAPDAMAAQTGPLKASGNVTFGTDAVAVEGLRAEIDRKVVEGRLAYAWSGHGRVAKLEGALSAGELDVDDALAIGRALIAGTKLYLPGEIALRVDIGTATVAGVVAKGVRANVKLDADGLAIERIAVADLGGAALNLTGAIEAPLAAPRGTLTLDLDARTLDGTAAVLAAFAPELGDAVRRSARELSPAKLRTTLNFDRADGTASRARLVVSGRAGAMRVNLTGEASGDPSALAAVDLNLTGRVEADDGRALVALVRLDRAVVVDKRAGALTFTAAGRIADLHVDGRLAAGGLEITAKGTAGVGGAVTAALDIAATAADARLPGRGDQPIAIGGRARLDVNGETLTFENVNGTVAGAALRGRVVLTLGSPLRLDGAIEADSINAASFVAAAAGMPKMAHDGAWPTEPFVRGAFADLTGQIEVKAARAAVNPTIAIQNLRAHVRFGAAESAVEDIEGTLAGGRLVGQLALRNGGDGLTVRGQVVLTNADAAALIPGETRPPITGMLGIHLNLEGSGLSPATLIGSLRGAGTVTLEQAQLAGLDPRAFAIVIRAVDQGTQIDAEKVRDMVAAGLEVGRLIVPRADGAFTLSAGELRWGTLVARADGANLAVTGSIGLNGGLLDGRLTLTSTVATQGSGANQPEILVALKGPFGAVKRTVDVSAFTGWLMLRSVEREAKRIETLESERANETALGATTPTNATPALAPPPATVPPPAVAPAPPATAVVPPAAERPPPRAARPKKSPPAEPRSVTTPHKRAPTLPPPVEIRPTPRVSSEAPRRTARPAENTPPPAAAEPPRSRSILDTLFGSQR